MSMTTSWVPALEDRLSCPAVLSWIWEVVEAVCPARAKALVTAGRGVPAAQATTEVVAVAETMVMFAVTAVAPRGTPAAPAMVTVRVPAAGMSPQPGALPVLSRLSQARAPARGTK